MNVVDDTAAQQRGRTRTALRLLREGAGNSRTHAKTLGVRRAPPKVVSAPETSGGAVETNLHVGCVAVGDAVDTARTGTRLASVELVVRLLCRFEPGHDK